MNFAQEHLPLITAICNPGLRDRHWSSLAEVVGFEIRRDEVTSLKRLLEYDIATHIIKLVEISDSASREWSIEKALDKMMTDWKGLAFELGPWKETGGCLRLCRCKVFAANSTARKARSYMTQTASVLLP